MTNEEWVKLNDACLAAYGEGLPNCILDYGYFSIPDDILRRFAEASIARGKPVDWAEILDPEAVEVFDENGSPRAVS